ncbi:MAG: hypothetical protein ACM3S1_00465 [Hyphomicrobiales bacterium]
MAEFENVEAWNTAVRLAAAVGRLKVASNLKASQDAQAKAFEQAGIACGLIAEGATAAGPAQAALYRDARGALAQAMSWLHVLANVTNEQPAVFGNELDLAEQASKQLGATLRTMERGGAGGRPPMRGGPPPTGPRNNAPAGQRGGPPRGGGPR